MNHQGTKAQSSVPVLNEPIPEELDLIGRKIVDSAFHVHSSFGPGLLESIYEDCMAIAFKKRGLNFTRQYSLSLEFEGERLENVCRPDFLVESSVVVELKCVEKISPVHEAQLLTYMKLVPTRLGYVINFNVPLIRDGIRRRAL